jgi:hypothetical protein
VRGRNPRVTPSERSRERRAEAMIGLGTCGLGEERGQGVAEEAEAALHGGSGDLGGGGAKHLLHRRLLRAHFVELRALILPRRWRRGGERWGEQVRCALWRPKTAQPQGWGGLGSDLGLRLHKSCLTAV